MQIYSAVFFSSDCEARGDSSPAQGSSSNGPDVELIDLTVDTSGSEDDEWWNHQGKVKCGTKVEVCMSICKPPELLKYTRNT